MRVRAASSADAQRCAEVSPLRSAEELMALLDQSLVKWLVIEDGSDTVVGVGIIHVWKRSGVAWVWDLTIEETQRNKGFGTALLQEMVHVAAQMGAKVLMDVERPKQTDLTALYLNNGFRVCGTNDRWFASDKDATAVFYGYDL